MGECKGGGDKIKIKSISYLFTLPFIPSRQGRGKELSDSLSIPLFKGRGTFEKRMSLDGAGSTPFSHVLPAVLKVTNFGESPDGEKC
jgi:hypothetical protein